MNESEKEKKLLLQEIKRLKAELLAEKAKVIRRDLLISSFRAKGSAKGSVK